MLNLLNKISSKEKPIIQQPSSSSKEKPIISQTPPKTELALMPPKVPSSSTSSIPLSSSTMK